MVVEKGKVHIWWERITPIKNYKTLVDNIIQFYFWSQLVNKLYRGFTHQTSNLNKLQQFKNHNKDFVYLYSSFIGVISINWNFHCSYSRYVHTKSTFIVCFVGNSF